MGLIKVKNKPPFCEIFGQSHVSARILSIKCGCHITLIWLSLVIQAFLVKITRFCTDSGKCYQTTKCEQIMWLTDTIMFFYTCGNRERYLISNRFCLNFRESLEYVIWRAFFWLTFNLEGKNETDKIKSRRVSK